MPWREQISNSLPEPDQPSLESIRQDIEDELADHLDCAYRRELLKTSNPEEARRRVVERFGDVCQVARQLWLQAWRHRLMAQKFALVVSGIAAACSVIACGLLIWFVQDAQRTSEELLRTNREAFGQLMNQISSIESQPPSGTPAASLDWNPLKIRALAGDRGLADATIKVVGNLLSPNEEVRLRKVTDAEGWADFGLVRPGSTRFTVTTPWGESAEFSQTVRAGEETLFTVQAPTGPPPGRPVLLRVEWPRRQHPDNLIVLCEFTRLSREFEQTYWGSSRSYYLLIDQDGTVYECATFTPLARTSQPLSPRTTKVFGPLRQSTGSLLMESGRYELEKVFLLERPEHLVINESESVDWTVAAAAIRGLPVASNLPAPWNQIAHPATRSTGMIYEIPAEPAAEPLERVIAIDDSLVVEARSNLYQSDDPNTPSRQISATDSRAVMLFLQTDTDFDEQLDAEEFQAIPVRDKTPSGDPIDIQFPVTLDKFLELSRSRILSPRPLTDRNGRR